MAKTLTYNDREVGDLFAMPQNDVGEPDFDEGPPLDVYENDQFEVFDSDMLRDEDFLATQESDHSIPAITPLSGNSTTTPEKQKPNGPEPFYIPGAQPGDKPLEQFTLTPPEHPLDPQQEAAAAHRGGHALVVAGAGSGKTTVIIDMAARKLEAGVSPAHFVMLTFSRKAAAEMNTRLTTRVGFDPGIKPTTFHAFFLKMMMRAPSRFGLNDEVSVMDDKDQKKVFEYILKQNNIAGVDFPTSSWQSGYSFCKNACLRAGVDIESMVEIVKLIRPFLMPKNKAEPLSDEQLVGALYDYESYCQRNNLLDYDDLILNPLEIFNANPKIAKAYSEKLSHLIIDEFQDTNISQYRLMKHLGQHCPNVIIVGDDDQSIYGWRGAHPENMQAFLNDFQATEYLIESNYRCAPDIVRKATAQVRLNTNRIEKNPRSMLLGSESGEVNLVTAKNVFDMNEDMITRIKDCLSGGIEPKDIAILYRSNRMLIEIEGDLIKSGLPYQVAGTAKLFDRQEVKLCLAAARLVVNPYDTPALWQISKLLPGVGDGAISKLIAFTEVNHEQPPLSDAALSHVKNAKAIESLLRLRGLLNELRQGKPDQWIPMVLDALNPISAFSSEMESKPTLYRRREANLAQLSQWAQNIECETWQELREILLEQEDPDKRHDKNHITISTIHKAKGLEWKYVHFVGFSQSIFPMEFNSGDDDGEDKLKDVEEERRLSYVAMTRAKIKCFFYHSNTYMTAKNVFFSISPFAAEIPFNHKLKAGGPVEEKPEAREHKAHRPLKPAHIPDNIIKL